MLALLSGTVIAQIIILLSTPILTRLYSPTDFGIYTFFISIYAILNSVVSLKYELAIPLVSNKEARTLFNTNILNGFIVSILIAIALYFINYFELYLLFNIGREFSSIWYYVPLSLMTYVIVLNVNYLLVQKKEFQQIATLNIARALFKVAIQLLLGFFGSLSVGLILGEVIGGVLLCVFLFFYLTRQHLFSYKIDFTEAKFLLKEYNKFPIYTMPAGLINSLGTHLTPIFIITLFGPVVGGVYALTHRALTIPIAFIGKSVSQVYLSKAPELYKTNIKSLRALYIKISAYLGLLTLPIIGVSLVGDTVFSIFFGEAWSEAGEYLKALVFLYIGQIVVVPLSQTLNIIGKNQIQLIWDISRLLIVSLIFMMISPFFSLTTLQTLYLYSLSMLVLYIILYISTILLLTKSLKK